MILELHVADVIDDHKNKMDAMRLKIRKIRKYAIHTEAWYHYATGSICQSQKQNKKLPKIYGSSRILAWNNQKLQIRRRRITYLLDK